MGMVFFAEDKPSASYIIGLPAVLRQMHSKIVEDTQKLLAFFSKLI
jgi:hypothetical protein